MNRQELLDEIARLKASAATVRTSAGYADDPRVHRQEMAYAAELERSVREMERQLADIK